jgi:hypothetical protein
MLLQLFTIKQSYWGDGGIGKARAFANTIVPQLVKLSLNNRCINSTALYENSSVYIYESSPPTPPLVTLTCAQDPIA